MNPQPLDLTVSELRQRVEKLEREKSLRGPRALLPLVSIGIVSLLAFSLEMVATATPEDRTGEPEAAAYIELGQRATDTVFEADVIRARRFETINKDDTCRVVIGNCEVLHQRYPGEVTEAGIFLVGSGSEVHAQFTIPANPELRLGTTSIPPGASTRPPDFSLSENTTDKVD